MNADQIIDRQQPTVYSNNPMIVYSQYFSQNSYLSYITEDICSANFENSFSFKSILSMMYMEYQLLGIININYF